MSDLKDYGIGLLAIVVIGVILLFVISVKTYGFKASVKPWLLMLSIVILVSIVVTVLYLKVI